ncbi:MAG: ATP-binding cassette domain-containing protein [Myxococcota bacterium]
MTEAPALILESFGVAFRDRVVLADVTAQVPARGVTVLMGPAGGGKSTLLRTLVGLNASQPELRTWGSARYQGQPIAPANRPALVQQDARYFASTVRENLVSSFPDRGRLLRARQNARIDELLAAAGASDLSDHLDDEALSLPLSLRRTLAVLCAMATGAGLVCLDETTASLEPDAAERVMGLMRWYARDRAVLFVTHNQLHARGAADHALLLAGGRIQEAAPAQAFFTCPTSAITRRFLENGSVCLPAPDADPAALAEGIAPPPPLPAAARTYVSATLGPRSFRWLRPGRLGGLPRPGIVASLEEDLEGLRRLGVTLLVTLEETATVPREALEAQGIASMHFPIPDMAAPSSVAAAALCGRLEAMAASGAVVAFHCRAGLGRTGTMLACQLIWEGATPVAALDTVRTVNPKWVQSDAQVQFLETFADYVRWINGPNTGRPPHAGPEQDSLERTKDVA